MITFKIYYLDSEGREIVTPIKIGADNRQYARELFEAKYPDYTIKRIIDTLDMDDNEYEAFMFI